MRHSTRQTDGAEDVPHTEIRCACCREWFNIDNVNDRGHCSDCAATRSAMRLPSMLNPTFITQDRLQSLVHLELVQ